MAISLQFEQADADVCVYKPPKVRRVCGTIVDSSGRPIPSVKVTVMKDGKALKTDETDENGEFDFQAILPGKYELDAKIPGFHPAGYQLTLSRPTNSCKHALRIEMEVGVVSCGGDIHETKSALARKH